MWHDVKISLPQQNGDYLVTRNGTTVEPANFQNGKWLNYRNMSSLLTLKDVSHWMPFPKYP
jgi:hypothetical protein